MRTIDVYEEDAARLDQISRGNGLLGGQNDHSDLALGLAILIRDFDDICDLLETTQEMVLIITQRYDEACTELNDIGDRFGAVMESLSCDFEDMFPDWDDEEDGD